MKLIESIQKDKTLKRAGKKMMELIACLCYQEKRSWITLEEFVFLESVHNSE